MLKVCPAYKDIMA